MINQSREFGKAMRPFFAEPVTIIGVLNYWAIVLWNNLPLKSLHHPYFDSCLHTTTEFDWYIICN